MTKKGDSIMKTIRDLKDIPMIKVSLTIPQPDFTEEEREFYFKKVNREICELNAKAHGLTPKWVKDNEGIEHFCPTDNRSFINRFFDAIF